MRASIRQENGSRLQSLFPTMTVERCRFACALVLALLAVGSAPGVLAESAKRHPIGLPNFHQVTGSIYRGGAPTKDGLKSLETMKIHTIIDLRISPRMVRAEKKLAESMGFAWLNIPMGKEAPTPKQVDTLLSVLAKAPKEPVFVHCQHGADRTGCMIGIYRVCVQRWSFSQAWAEMRKYGFKPHLSALKEAVRSRRNTVDPVSVVSTRTRSAKDAARTVEQTRRPALHGPRSPVGAEEGFGAAANWFLKPFLVFQAPYVNVDVVSGVSGILFPKHPTPVLLR